MPRSARPLTAVLGGLALAATGLVALPSAAHAASISSGSFGITRQVNEVGPATCTVGNPSGNDGSSFTSNGVAVSKTVSGTTTLVDQGDGSDTQSIAQSAMTKVRARDKAGQLSSVVIENSLSADFAIAQGAATDCDAQSQLTSQTVFSVTLGGARWVTVDVSGIDPNGSLTLLFQRSSPASPTVQEVVVASGTEKRRLHEEILLPAGTYTVVDVTSVTWQGPSVNGDPTSFSAKPMATLGFSATGSAKGKASSPGSKWLSTDSARSCAKGSLGTKFTGAAGKVAGGVIEKAIFRVNGKKATTVNKPKKGTKVKLKGLVDDLDLDLKVTMRFANGATVTLTRSYWSCT